MTATCPPPASRLTRLAVAALVATGAAFAATASAQTAQRPNVLLILADNLGYGELASTAAARCVAHPRPASTSWPAKARA